jgi:hypothetical protein
MIKIAPFPLPFAFRPEAAFSNPSKIQRFKQGLSVENQLLAFA